jgi:NitT/TauT family transport system substrate-binding protein
VQNLQAGVYNSALLTGQVDVVPAYLNGGFISLRQQAEAAGKSVHAIASRDFNLDIYQLCVIATDKTIQDNPALLRAFVTATVKGLQYTIAHPEEAVQILQNAIPTLDQTATVPQVAEVIKVVDTPAFRASGIGIADEQKLTRTRDVILQAYGVSATLNTSEIHTNEFVK